MRFVRRNRILFKISASVSCILIYTHRLEVEEEEASLMGEGEEERLTT